MWIYCCQYPSIFVIVDFYMHAMAIKTLLLLNQPFSRLVMTIVIFIIIINLFLLTTRICEKMGRRCQILKCHSCVGFCVWAEGE